VEVCPKLSNIYSPSFRPNSSFVKSIPGVVKAGVVEAVHVKGSEGGGERILGHSCGQIIEENL
jgi:hypothetical protein